MKNSGKLIQCHDELGIPSAFHTSLLSSREIVKGSHLKALEPGDTRGAGFHQPWNMPALGGRDRGREGEEEKGGAAGLSSGGDTSNIQMFVREWRRLKQDSCSQYQWVLLVDFPVHCVCVHVTLLCRFLVNLGGDKFLQLFRVEIRYVQNHSIYCNVSPLSLSLSLSLSVWVYWEKC